MDSRLLKPLNFGKSLLLFGLPTIYFCFIAYLFIPFFKALKIHPALSWFYGGYLLFVPLFILALVMYRMEGLEMKYSLILNRFRINKLTLNDWKWTMISACVIIIFTGVIMFLSRNYFDLLGLSELKTTPPFMEFETLTGYQRLYLLVWLPMFFFNIVGEEVLWRGYILPRQELRHGSYAWVVNSMLWLVFHLPFGLDLLIILLPTLLIIPWVAYKTKNTTIGIITHALLNGPMFVLLSLGII